MLMTGISGTCLAQTADPFNPSVNSQTIVAVSPVFKARQPGKTYVLPVTPREEKPPGLVKKTWGQILTITGSAAVVIGLAMYNNSGQEDIVYTNGGYYYHRNNEYDAGAALIGHGIVMTAIGVPFWIVGAHQYNRFTREQGLSFQMKGAMGSLTYRF